MPALSPTRIALIAWGFSLLFSLPGFVQAALVNGTICYALDDSFIMMALAKNLAFYKVWGMTPYAFSSTASSILFTGLLALFFRLAGDSAYLPLILNAAALLGLFYTTARLAAARGLNNWQTWMLLMGLHFFMPVPVLLFGAMEHILHTWIAVWVLYKLVDPRRPATLPLTAAAGLLLGSIRFEGLFEGGLIALVLLLNGERIRALAFGAALLLPTLALGLISLREGWFFFPNSLILKAYGMNIQETGSVLTYLLSMLSKAGSYPHAMAAMLALYLLYGSIPRDQKKERTLTAVVFLTSALHFLLARYHHVFRYEAYLMALAWIPLWTCLCRNNGIQNMPGLWAFVKKEPFMAVFSTLLLLGPVWRSVNSYAVGTRAMCNIYQQQVQTGKFIAAFYPDDPVAAIDIGAITYYSTCRLTDLWGLGTMEMARLKLAGRYEARAIDAWCRKEGVRVAIVYGRKLAHPAWKTVERWVIPHNVVCAQDTIDFVAIFPEEESVLRKNLARFRHRLPAPVTCIPIP
jgi:hypothetical protein